MRVNQTVGGHFRRLDRRHRRRDGALPDGIRRLESAKFPTKRAQRARPARSLYQLRWRRCQPIGVAMRLIIEARLEGGETSETERRPLLLWNERTGASPTWDLHLPK